MTNLACHVFFFTRSTGEWIVFVFWGNRPRHWLFYFVIRPLGWVCVFLCVCAFALLYYIFLFYSSPLFFSIRFSAFFFFRSPSLLFLFLHCLPFEFTHFCFAIFCFCKILMLVFWHRFDSKSTEYIPISDLPAHYKNIYIFVVVQIFLLFTSSFTGLFQLPATCSLHLLLLLMLIYEVQYAVVQFTPQLLGWLLCHCTYD